LFITPDGIVAHGFPPLRGLELAELMASQKATNAPVWGAQINDRQCKSLICKESENGTFRF